MSNCNSLIEHKATPPLPIGRLWAVAALLGTLFLATTARAVDVLTVHELASHCALQQSEPAGADSQHCMRYVQGFIDGAIATDARVMLNTKVAINQGESFSDRAKRTRAPNRASQLSAATLAGFCLSNRLPLNDVVDKIVAELARLDFGDSADSPARESVYKTLKKHYPCADE